MNGHSSVVFGGGGGKTISFVHAQKKKLYGFTNCQVKKLVKLKHKVRFYSKVVNFFSRARVDLISSSISFPQVHIRKQVHIFYMVTTLLRFFVHFMLLFPSLFTPLVVLMKLNMP